MAEQIFKAPGFYDREIDLSTRQVNPFGTPAVVIGTSFKGPAFVPTTMGSFSDFQVKFGDLNLKFPASYMMQKWFENRFSATYLRVLGAGANSTDSDISTTQTKGTVKNAGVKISGSAVGSGDNRFQGAVQFLVAKHAVTGSEVLGFPMFSDNNTFFTTGSSTDVYLVRGMIMTAYDTRIMVMSSSDTFTGVMDDYTSLDAGPASPTYKKFKLVVSCSQGSTFATTDNIAGIKVLTASLDPTNSDYVGKVLNSDPDKFETARHLFYCDFAVDAEIAMVQTGSNVIAIVSGSSNTSTTSGDASLLLRDAYGRFDTRYTTPKTTWFISQPFGQTEYNLFYVESLDDGAYANNKIKVSIANLKASSDPKNDYGTFALLVRDFSDTDVEPKILEQYVNLTLDPTSDNYVAKVVGDVKVVYSFDVVNPDDRRLVKMGNNPNRSKYIRVVMNSQVDRKMSPGKALPFGFRGVEILNTNPTLTDGLPVGGVSGSLIRLGASGSYSGSVSLNDDRLLAAVLPPLPYRFKVTRGEVSTAAGFTGYPGPSEVVDSRLYWGVKFERNTNILNPNVSNEPNALVAALTKFEGIEKLDVLVTGSYTDTFSNNKFTLARVCLSNVLLSDVTASAVTHMKETAYIRNGTVNPSDYTVSDTNGTRVSLATLLMKSSASADFNRFSDFTKFTTVLYGGWDGFNILDKNANRMNDKASSTESGGGANVAYLSPGFGTNQSGTGKLNSTIFSYQTATSIVTDPIQSQHNLLAIPGIREPFVTDDASVKTRDHALSMFVMDIPYYDFNDSRIFDGDTGKYIDVENTADTFEGRAIDNNHAIAYFPNVVIDDTTNNRRVTVPASVAAMAALGYNDRVAFPWYAPAGFNRAALSFVNLTQVKINQPDRTRLTEVKINPITKFPRESFVIMAQNTLQQAQSSLSSINVKRMVLEVKRLIVEVGNRTLFEKINSQTREELVKQFTAILGSVQTKAGLQKFSVVCDATNNTVEDEAANRMNCQVNLTPVKSVEIIAINFIVLQTGVTFT